MKQEGVRWSVIYIQHAIFNLLPPAGHFSFFLSRVYLWKADRTHMLLSAMFCFTVAPLHTSLGDVHERAAVHGRLLGVAQGDGCSKDILTAAAKERENITGSLWLPSAVIEISSEDVTLRCVTEGHTQGGV